MKNVLNRILLMAMLLIVSLISACDSGSDTGQLAVDGDNADMAFAAPALLLSSRTIDKDNLVLRVTIGSAVTDVRADVNGEYRLVTELPENSSTTVTLEWFEIIGDEELTLAIASKPLNAGTRDSPAVLSFSNDEFDTSADDDNDGFSNLVERRDGYLFDDPNSPIAPPVLVDLRLELNLPKLLEDAPGEVRSQIDAQASINGDDVGLSRDGDVWRGQAVVTENTEPLVRVDFFATDNRLIRIANRSRSTNVGPGATAVFTADDYDEGLDPLNDDGDDFNNAEELVLGTGLTDKADPDYDLDDLSFDEDNCPRVANPGQEDIDDDGLGDACDDVNNNDTDDDGIDNDDDNCPAVANRYQADIDNDGRGDACDSTDDRDSDGDNVIDSLDNCRTVSNTSQADQDDDDIGDDCDDDRDGDGRDNGPDNCPLIANPDQADVDNDGQGDACDDSDDTDGDGDNVIDRLDNCPAVANPEQTNLDNDNLGDACDADRDGDDINNGPDNCPSIANPDQADVDNDGQGDACDDSDDTDGDGDNVIDRLDNCPAVANPGQVNLDNDNLGDACDADRDGDDVNNGPDNCPSIANPDQTDIDDDGRGDACDGDRDGDGINNGPDNCPLIANTNQKDTDMDGEGDVCDDTPNGPTTAPEPEPTTGTTPITTPISEP